MDIAGIEATGNRAMLRAAGKSHVLTHIFDMHCHRYDARMMQATCLEHRAILEAIRTKSSDQAAAAAAAHIRRSLELSL